MKMDFLYNPAANENSLYLNLEFGDISYFEK